MKRAIQRGCAVLLGLFMVQTSMACVPNESAESPQGPSIEEGVDVAVGSDEVVGRPTTLPGGMGGAIDIGGGGDEGGSVTGGGTGSETPTTFTGGTGHVTEGGITVNDDGTTTITPAEDGAIRVDGGVFTRGPESRLVNKTTAPGGGTFTGGTVVMKPGATVEPTPGGITFSGDGTISGATGTVTGGVPVAPGSSTVTVDEGPSRFDSNQSYVE